MSRTKTVMLAVTIGFVLSSHQAVAVVPHDVNDALGFQDALLMARSNGDDDIINLAPGTYKISENGGNPFRYIGVGGENFSLTIVGAGADQTILDGELSVRVMDVDTTGVVGGGPDAGISIQGMTFRQGQRTGSGGGLFIRTTDSDISLADSVFELNTVVGGGSDPFDGGGGGAMLLSDGNGNVNVSGSVFSDNDAEGGGGLIVVTVNGNGSVSGCVIDSNQAESAGGVGMLGFASRIVFVNNIVRRNIALGPNGAGGAALQTANQPIDVVHNTFFDNAATKGGGLIVGSQDAINLFNNLFAENSASAGTGVDIFVLALTPSPTISLFNNIFSEFCVETGSCDPVDLGGTQGGNLIGVDPLLMDPGNGNFHLLPGSPAINAGNPAAPSLPATDFEGDARVQGPAPDIGADEANACGNGTVETGEECDDGNITDGDDCTSACQTVESGGCSLVRSS